jgi:aspartate racemase
VGITLGIIGGIAPPSTVDYYRALVDGFRERRPDAYPSIIINSIDLTRLLGLIGDGRMGELVDWLAAEIDRLARAGAGCALLAANTPHVVFDELRARSPVPLLSIVEAAADAAAERGLRDVGILGTRFTMLGSFYPDVFARRGITVRAPADDDAAYVHDKYVTELIPARYLPETRVGVLRVIERLVSAGADGVLLAGTELPLLLRDAEPAGVPLLDTNRIHIQRALAELLAW